MKDDLSKLTSVAQRGEGAHVAIGLVRLACSGCNVGFRRCWRLLAPTSAPQRLRRRIKAPRSSGGFSLIELMVVLVILGLLAGLVGPQLFGNVDKANVRTADTQAKMLKAALQTYRLDMGQYPTTAQGLAALVSPPTNVSDYWDGPYLEDELPLDPWRTPYVYRFPANNMHGFALYSLGADSVEGGEDVNADVGFLPTN